MARGIARAAAAALLGACLACGLLGGVAAAAGAPSASAGTTVSITTTGLAIAGRTDDFAASLAQIAAEPDKYVLRVVVEGAAGACSYSWSRTCDGVPDRAFACFDERCRLADHLDRLETGRDYVYAVEVADEAGARASAQVSVRIAQELLYVTVEVQAGEGRGGTVTPSGTFTVAPGTSQTFYVYPDEGYDLERVLVNGLPVEASPLARDARPAPARVRTFSTEAAPRGHAAYFFTVDDFTDDTVVEVTFKKIAGPDDPDDPGNPDDPDPGGPEVPTGPDDPGDPSGPYDPAGADDGTLDASGGAIDGAAASRSLRGTLFGILAATGDAGRAAAALALGAAALAVAVLMANPRRRR